MAMAAALQAPLERLSADDFETASVRSAAPSYFSDAPSYHSTAIPTEPSPPYTPAVTSPLQVAPSSAASPSGPQQQQQRVDGSLVTGATTASTRNPPQRVGLPPIPPGPPRRAEPSLSEFRIPNYSTFTIPNARHYNVASRRAARGGSFLPSSSFSSLPRVPPIASPGPAPAALAGAGAHQRTVLERIEEDERQRRLSRPLEDPDLVGETAAALARRKRLLREGLYAAAGDEVLLREDRRWDWLLAQMNDWDERERSWALFRRKVDRRTRRGLLSRLMGR